MRLEQLAKACRRRGGECPCPIESQCKALEVCGQEMMAAAAERRSAEARIRKLEQIQQRLESPLATLREDFKFREGLTPVMVMDDGEACFGYEDADGEWIDSDEWPFNESYVFSDDCERNGIRVE